MVFNRIILFCMISLCFTYCKTQNIDRIVGGASADISQFPYQISISVYDFMEEIRKHICGGSILRENIVATAAHCTQGPPALQKTFEVRAGSTSSIEGGQSIKVDRIVDHEDYNGYTIDNDISILVLASRLVFSETVQSIPIASNARSAGSLATVSGWGFLFENSGISSTYLNYVQVPVIDKNTCQTKFYADEKLTPSMMCAGYPQGGKDSCTTDSGGPLAEDGELIAIVSWGTGCGGENRPGVYTDVFYMRDWILSKLKELSV